MINITYNPTRKITTADLWITCDPPIKFTVRTRLPAHWDILNREWGNRDDKESDPQTAMKLIAEAFLTVAQGNASYELNTIEHVEALRDSIEEGQPGIGNDFICLIAETFAVNHYSFLTLASAAYVKPSRRSNAKAKKNAQIKS